MTNIVKDLSGNLPLGLGISQKEVLDILQKDASLVTTKSKKYSYMNAGQYYCAINAWVALCYDVCGSRPARFLRNAILDKGLLRVVDDASKAANIFIGSNFESDGDSYLYPLFTEDSKETLQVLRFLKRFSPMEADKVKDESLDAFFGVNSRIDRGVATEIDAETGRVTKREYRSHPWLLASVREYCHQMLGSAPTWDEVFQQAHFSNGVTADGCRTLSEKIGKYSLYEPYLLDMRYPLSTAFLKEALDYVKVVAVPKSYKSWRIIAEVPAYQQFWMQGIREAAVRATQKSHFGPRIVQDDQTLNQEWSWLGSIDGRYATLDLSAASDSIGQALAESILPSDWMELIKAVNPPMIQLGNKLRVKRHIFQTSGNGTTFIFESVIFLAIASAATYYVSLYTGELLWQPRTFGDDLIVDGRVYDTMIDFLTMLGFKVNVDKSFGTGFYRESCGAEWYCGLDFSSRYWPRKELNLPLNEKPDPKNKSVISEVNRSLESLIAVQHKLYQYETVDAFLVPFIREYALKICGIKEVTSSLPGTECCDLWEAYPQFQRKRAPHDGELAKYALADLPHYLTRERHLVLNSVYEHKSWWLPNVDMYNYVNFLIHGPRYETPLDKILGVSAATAGDAESAEVAESQWGYTWL